ncbi:MAG: hypothetical protein IKM55_00675 [Bacilli bacterium]|nr:hypothetical protein [Bacilli bacterium]
MGKFRKVDAKHYVVLGLESGELVPFSAKKCGKVIARRGNVGERVVTYTDGGIVEKEDVVEVDLDTGLPGWILTKVDDSGTPIVDEFGHKNEWIRDDSDFSSEYVMEKGHSMVFKSIDGPQLFVQALNDITIVQNGEMMNVEAGGYLNISDLNNIYAISKRDFDDTYIRVEDISMKKAM